jgi:hypothetical protein
MRTIVLTILASALMGGGGVYAWRYYGGFVGEQQQVIAFIDAYGAYAEVAERVEVLVHLPGTQGNSDRAELLELLNSVLTGTIDSTRREELARLAFNNLTTLKKEIDGAQAAQALLYEELQKLDAASKVFSGIARQRDAADIVEQARKRAELSARITSILSEMNDHVYAIITRILEDRGELTSAHAQDINASTDAAEDRFDTLSGLYAELIDKRTDIEMNFTDFAKHAL